MVPEAAAAVSVKPTDSSEHKVTGRTDASAPEVPMPAQKSANGYKRLVRLGGIYIYEPPVHLKFAGVAKHPTHTQEYLQAIQEYTDKILSP